MSKPMSVNQSLLQAREADSVDPDTGTKFAWHALYSRAFFLSGQEVLVTLGPAGHLCLDQDDVVGVEVGGAEATVHYGSLPPSQPGDAARARSTRRPRQLRLRLADAEEASGFALAGRALYERQVAPLLRAAGVSARVVATAAAGEATSAVRELDPRSVEAIAVVGGDGTVHEVVQGLLGRPDWREAARLPLVQVPAGSGNGLAASTGLWSVFTAVHALVKGSLRPCDVASVLQPGHARRFSFLSLTYGMIPNLDVGTDHLRFLGSVRFVLGAVWQILKQGTYEVHVAYVDVDKAAAERAPDALQREPGPPLRFAAAVEEVARRTGAQGPALLAQLPAPWERLISGPIQFFAACNIPWLDTNFHVAPLTKLNDGHLTLLFNVGKRGRIQSLRLMSAMDSGQHLDQLHCAKPIAFVLELGKNNDTWVVIDGEEVPHARAFVEVHPSLISVFVAPH
ncbi:hypothetical protein QBZ16_004803 [Prototheca wickerhamii]|uniref:DAGKc domain-containing protein n=1 Tax=Prototheca wickerhamii TaxID=3111 RepID=A0AAD9IHD5_PROWI|nr:hypothetical protein QBZ16_004803 [Prototheca wickerhamii]